MRNKFKLDFVVVGAQKSGTTALYSFLNQHPKLSFGFKKELHYFDNDTYFSKNQELNKQTLKRMFSFSFKNFFIQPLKGDVTPFYMYSESAIERIRVHNPEIKIICILRNPIERAYSHWNMQVSKGIEKNDFGYSIENESKRLIDNNTNRIYSYKSRGLYSSQILNLLSSFPMKNCLILKHEDLTENHQKTLNKIFDFLDVKSIEIEQQTIHSYKKEDIDIAQKENLIKFFKEDILKTESILNWDLTNWLK